MKAASIASSKVAKLYAVHAFGARDLLWCRRLARNEALECVRGGSRRTRHRAPPRPARIFRHHPPRSIVDGEIDSANILTNKARQVGDAEDKRRAPAVKRFHEY